MATIDELICGFDDDERGMQDDDAKMDCCFPGKCCMPSDHFVSECHTAGMAEQYGSECRAF